MNKIKMYLLISLVITTFILPSCFSTVHETSTNYPTMSFQEAKDIIKESIKNTQQNPYFAEQKAVSDVVISENGLTLIHPDGTKKYYLYNEIINPVVVHEALHNLDFIEIKKNNVGDAVLFNSQKSAVMFADALSYLKHNAGQGIKKEHARESEDCLRQVRNTSIDLILAGATAKDLNLSCPGVSQNQIEATINDMLVEWKSKGLRGLLQRSTAAQLNDLVIKMEKGILKLDLKAKQLKDVADENARQVKAPGQAAPATKAPDTLTQAHLLDQRKTLLMVILGSIKQVAARRGPAG